jgi:hypothetical protein
MHECMHAFIAPASILSLAIEKIQKKVCNESFKIVPVFSPSDPAEVVTHPIRELSCLPLPPLSSLSTETRGAESSVLLQISVISAHEPMAT